MKKKIPALIVAMSISQTAFAAFDVTPTKDGIKISGQSEGNSVVFVYAPGETPGKLDGNTEGEEFSLMGKIMAEGSYADSENVNKTFKLPDDAVFGEYKVYVKTDNGVEVIPVNYVNYRAVENFFEKCGDESADIKAEFINLADIAGLDITLYRQLPEKYQTSIAESLAAVEEADANDAFDRVKELLAEGVVTAALAGDDAEFAKKCIDEYGDKTDIFPEIYAELGSETERVIKKVIGKTEDKEELKKEILYYSTV